MAVRTSRAVVVIVGILSFFWALLDAIGNLQTARDIFENRGPIWNWIGFLLFSPWLGPTVAAGCVMLMLILRWRDRRSLGSVDDTSRMGQDNTVEPHAVSFNVPSEYTVRIKYSSRQIVEVSNAPGNYNDTLNLDNAGTMVEVGPSDHNTIHMILTDATPLTIERPQADVRYQAGRGVSSYFPAAGSPWIDIRDARSIDATGSKEYIFTRFGAGRSHLVAVRMRKFRVSLDAVNDRSKPGHMLIEYVFGISEE